MSTETTRLLGAFELNAFEPSVFETSVSGTNVAGPRVSGPSAVENGVENAFEPAALESAPAPDGSARREAELRGYAAGYAAGARRAERILAERLAELEAAAARERRAERDARAEREERLDSIAAALERRTEPVLREARSALLAAAVELAEALLGTELSDAERSARAIARRVLAAPEAPAVTRLRVHPEEASLVTALLGPRPFETVADPSLSRGDAVAELPAGLLDARVSTALARVRRALDEGVAA